QSALGNIRARSSRECGEAAAEFWTDPGAESGIRFCARRHRDLDGRGPATRSRGDTALPGKNRGRLRPGERVEAFAERPLAHAATAEPHRELVDGEAFGARAARFWHDV